MRNTLPIGQTHIDLFFRHVSDATPTPGFNQTFLPSLELKKEESFMIPDPHALANVTADESEKISANQQYATPKYDAFFGTTTIPLNQF